MIVPIQVEMYSVVLQQVAFDMFLLDQIRHSSLQTLHIEKNLFLIELGWGPDSKHVLLALALILEKKQWFRFLDKLKTSAYTGEA